MAKAEAAITDVQEAGDAPLIDLNEANVKKLIARAKTLKISGSIGVATVEVFSKESDETLCVFGTATMRAMDLPGGLRQP